MELELLARILRPIFPGRDKTKRLGINIGGARRGFFVLDDGGLQRCGQRVESNSPVEIVMKILRSMKGTLYLKGLEPEDVSGLEIYRNPPYYMTAWFAPYGTDPGDVDLFLYLTKDGERVRKEYPGLKRQRTEE